MADDEGFRTAMREAIRQAGLSQAAFGQALAEEEGRDGPYHQTVVADWLAGRYQPSMEATFAAERVLDLAPGALSRHLGYLPSYLIEPASVADAIDADPALTPAARSMLKAAYAAAVDELDRSSSRRSRAS